MTKELKSKYSFDVFMNKGFVNYNELCRIYNSELDFEVQRINFKSLSKKLLHSLDRESLMHYQNSNGDFRFDSKKISDQDFEYHNKKDFDFLYWSTNLKKPSEEYRNRIFLDDLFVLAYEYDYWFVGDQNETMINNYISLDKPYQHLHVYEDKHGLKRINISANPGRRRFLNNDLEIMAAWRMWFSKQARGMFSGKRMEDFPFAFKIETLPNEVLFIQLFENVTESEREDSLAIMQEFRSWVQMDNLTGDEDTKKYRIKK